MKKVNRITKNEDFAKLVHSTKPIRNECFLVYGKINDLNYGRVGISVSKKGGHVIYVNYNRETGQENLSTEQAIDIATKFLNDKLVKKFGLNM